MNYKKMCIKDPKIVEKNPEFNSFFLFFFDDSTNAKCKANVHRCQRVS